MQGVTAGFAERRPDAVGGIGDARAASTRSAEVVGGGF
jgi:hypothetical protein